jgi:hypothetical protein
MRVRVYFLILATFLIFRLPLWKSALVPLDITCVSALTDGWCAGPKTAFSTKRRSFGKATRRIKKEIQGKLTRMPIIKAQAIQTRPNSRSPARAYFGQDSIPFGW